MENILMFYGLKCIHCGSDDLDTLDDDAEVYIDFDHENGTWRHDLVATVYKCTDCEAHFIDLTDTFGDT